MKKLKFYVPALLLTGSLSFMNPRTVVLADEDEEILYIETEGNEVQVPIDETIVPSNTITSTHPTANDEVPPVEEATADRNDNQQINADENYYFDNTNYYPATDPSDNPGEYIPDDVLDEVDRKGLNPDEPDTELDPEDPEDPIPEDIPKMGIISKSAGQLMIITVPVTLVGAALIDLLRRLKNNIIDIKDEELETLKKEEKKLSL